MKKMIWTRAIAGILTLCLLLGNLGMLPAFAAGDDDPNLYVDRYVDFVEELKVLEGYANSYLNTQSKYKDAGELIVNFIRTGVERYNESLWPQLAGQEITGFVDYVKAQDAANNTTAMRLRNIKFFKLPNGNSVDFGHMFGTLNIAYINVTASADLGGWAGDICDLLNYSYYHGNVPEGTVEEMAAYILENCFGVDAEDAFGMDDFYGDLDAFYLVNQMKAGKTLSTVMEEYFTEELDDGERSAYFLNNRFKGLKTQEDVRNAVYGAYISNAGLSVLEADRGLTQQADLRKACCYAFADYVYAKGGDRLTGEDGGEEPGPGEEPKPEEPTPDNPYYTVFSSSWSNLAPGITQEIKYATTADGKQIVYYVATVDVTRDDVTIVAGYKDANPGNGWGMQRVLDQAEAMQALRSNPEDAENYVENFQVIVATNADGYNMSTGEPTGLLIMGGVEWHPADGDGFFAILSDGSAMIGTKDDYAVYKDQIVDAVGSFGTTLIKDGQIAITASSNYYISRASRTAIGLKADGSVVMMVLDGRQEPFSAGGSMEEIAQIMLDAGCVHAINLDGGGSSTFVAKQEGTDELTVVNSPSDGYARSVSTSLIAVSTAVVSTEFSYAAISSEYDYLTIGTELKLNAVGVSSSGHGAVIPENAVWQLSDDTMGTIVDGIFTALENGEVEVQLVVDGAVVGSKTLYVVVPDKVAFEYDTLNVIYGVPTELPVNCYYQGNPVAYNLDDIWVYPEDAKAAYVDGITLTGSEKYGMRKLVVWVELNEDWDITDQMVVYLFKADEAIFDFDNATGGDKQFAWNREVANATVIDGLTFQILDTQKEMDVTYVFALDMKEIKIPEKLLDIVYMLPGGDNADASAWDFLMQLAERVSVLTEVRVTAQFDMDLDVDISQLKIANDYFYPKSVTLDEATNTVTLVCGWVDQTQALDPNTANSMCILSGIVVKPKADAAWDAADQLDIVVSGKVSYDVYLRANALYSFALIEENQEKYGLYPFDNKDVIINGSTEKGAHFADTYVNFEDHFILDSTNRQGWYNYDSCLYYFVDNVALTGLQKLPGYEDPNNMYLYRFNEDGSCEGVVTGLIELDDGLYYYVAGVAKTGWQVLAENGVKKYYFFNTASGRALNGTQKIGEYTYVFTDYVLTRGALVVNSIGTRYMWAGEWATQEWIELDGKIAYARSNAYFATGLQYRYSPAGDWTYYAFSDDGWWMKDFSGIYDWNGGTYLIKEGIVTDYPGLFEWEGAYYYIASTNVMIKNRYYWISKTNGIVPEGSYWFDADGKMTMPENTKPEEPKPEEPKPEEPKKNGIYAEDGSLFYYENGVRTYAGLIEIDGNYYYVRTSGELAHDVWYWPTKTNGLMETTKQYYFDSNGVMQDPPFEEEKPEEPKPEEPKPEEPGEPVKSGIYAEDGSLYYYENGVRTYAGLIEIEGNYYYVRTSGELAHDVWYWPTKTNGLMETTKQYYFDSNGIMQDPPFGEEKPEEPKPDQPGEVKNGIVAENGSLWYYVDGELYYAGLIRIGDYHYYVRSNGEVVHDQWYWPTKTNGLMVTTQQYYFGPDGVMWGSIY